MTWGVFVDPSPRKNHSFEQGEQTNIIIIIFAMIRVGGIPGFLTKGGASTKKVSVCRSMATHHRLLFLRDDEGLGKIVSWSKFK